MMARLLRSVPNVFPYPSRPIPTHQQFSRFKMTEAAKKITKQEIEEEFDDW